jgi:hypothetical protein
MPHGGADEERILEKLISLEIVNQEELMAHSDSLAEQSGAVTLVLPNQLFIYKAMTATESLV